MATVDWKEAYTLAVDMAAKEFDTFASLFLGVYRDWGKQFLKKNSIETLADLDRVLNEDFQEKLDSGSFYSSNEILAEDMSEAIMFKMEDDPSLYKDNPYAPTHPDSKRAKAPEFNVKDYGGRDRVKLIKRMLDFYLDEMIEADPDIDWDKFDDFEVEEIYDFLEENWDFLDTAEAYNWALQSAVDDFDVQGLITGIKSKLGSAAENVEDYWFSKIEFTGRSGGWVYFPEFPAEFSYEDVPLGEEEFLKIVDEEIQKEAKSIHYMVELEVLRAALWEAINSGMFKRWVDENFE